MVAAGRIEIPGGAAGVNGAEHTEESVRTIAPDSLGDSIAAIMRCPHLKGKRIPNDYRTTMSVCCSEFIDRLRSGSPEFAERSLSASPQ